MPYRIELTEDALIAGLRQYCRLAPAFESFYQRIQSNTHPEDAALLQTLQTAIQNADYQNKIYFHENVDLYLLYLIEYKKIPFWQGITQYTYWLMLIEFVDGEKNHFARRPKRQDYVKVFSLTDVIAGEGVTYAKRIYDEFSKKLKNNHFNAISFEAYQSVIESLSASDRAVFQVDISEGYQLVESAEAMRIQLGDYIRDAINFSMIVRLDNPNYRIIQLIVPSIAFTQAIFARFLPNAIQFKPVIGVVGLEKLRDKLHKAHQHPLALYSPRVKNNLLSVHDMVPSALMPWVHDVTHAFVGSIMEATMRDVLHGVIVPWLKTGLLEACGVNPASVAALLEEIAELNFVGSIVNQLAAPFNQLIQYISCAYPEGGLELLYFLYQTLIPAEDNYQAIFSAYAATSPSFFANLPESRLKDPIDPLDSSLNSRYSSARMTTGT